MRRFPTPVQRKYLADLAEMAGSPRKDPTPLSDSRSPPPSAATTSGHAHGTSSTKVASLIADCCEHLATAIAPAVARMRSLANALPTAAPLGSDATALVISPASRRRFVALGEPLRLWIVPLIVAAILMLARAAGAATLESMPSDGLDVEMQRFWLAVLLALILQVCSLPLLMCWMLWRRNHRATRSDTETDDDDPSGEDGPASPPERGEARTWPLGFATHRGLVRRNNEDAGCAFSIGPHQVIILADGVGGMKHGQAAAQIAVRAAQRAIRLAWRITPADCKPHPAAVLSCAFAAAAARLAAGGLSRGFASLKDGLRTTLMIVIGTAHQFHFGYIGDGAIYVVRQGGQVEPLMVAHKADPALQNVLAASLGPILHGAPVLGATERRPSDFLIAATDGIADRVLPSFYGKTLLHRARASDGALGDAAAALLQQLATHRSDGVFTFDDNMTLGLMGGASMPEDPAPAAAGPAMETA